jgi:peroxiredoxin
MKHFKLALVPLLAFVWFTFPGNLEVKELEVGTVGPMFDYQMDEISGNKITLADAKGENGTLVIFSCSTCPYVRAWEDRYLTISELAKELNIGMIAVNPNEATRAQGSSLADMKKRSDEIGYTFPYALDKDHKLADAYGATRTPHVYLLNKNNILVFVGAIDDNSRSAADVENTYLADAMNELVAGQAITQATSRAIGCTIKRL